MDKRAINDRELIREVLSGNKSAFQLFVKRFERLVWHIVRRMVQNESDREDIAQEVFLKMFRSLDSFRHDCRMSSWVARISYNTALNYLEKKKVPLFNDISGNDDNEYDQVDGIASMGATPAENVEASDTASRVRYEIERMGQPYSTIISLYHVEQMTYDEIAKITGLPMGTVKSYLYRARKLLKNQLLARYKREDIWK